MKQTMVRTVASVAAGIVCTVVALVLLLAVTGWQSGFIGSQGLRIDSIGSQLYSLETCPTTKTITVSATTTEILPVVAGKKNRICSYVIARTDVAAVVATAKLVEGTGTNCATGQTNLTGIVAAFASGAVGFAHWASMSGLTATTAGDAVCVTEAGAASSVDVTITYAPAY